jgi:hypothetical protein
VPLLQTSLEAAKGAGIPNNRIYILELPKEFSGDIQIPFKTVGQLIAEGTLLPKLEPLKWEKGQGKRQTAYLCYSSGTSGLPVRDRFVVKPNILSVQRVLLSSETIPTNRFWFFRKVLW